MKIYQQLATSLNAIRNCQESNNAEWEVKHTDTINQLMDSTAPSGSGINSGTQFDFDSKDDKLVFYTSYHHMSEYGYYDGWTDHKVIVTPSLQFDFNLRITGKNRNEIKDYLHDVFSFWLQSEYDK